MKAIYLKSKLIQRLLLLAGKEHIKEKSVLAKTVRLDNDEVAKYVQVISSLIPYNHPNLLKVIGVAKSPSFITTVSEYFDGIPMFFLISEDCEELKPRKVSIALDIALAINYLHTLSPPIHHGDLSLSNILINDTTWKIKLADYGMQQSRTENFVLSTACFTSGCMRYMAPEAFTDPNIKHLLEQDIYAYSIVLWEIMHTAIAFRGFPNQMQLIRDVCSGTRERIGKVVQTKYADIGKLIERCWDKDIKSRPIFSEIVSILQKRLSAS